MLSSQVACVNHLFSLRKYQKLITALLKEIDDRIVESQFIDDGYIEFEVMGGKNQNPLGEKESGKLQNGKEWMRKRGAFSTSIDALMIGKKGKEFGGKNILILIEWKYTEKGEESFYDSENHSVYKELLQHQDCPIIVHDDIKKLFYEPYYQPMRQTLLGWKMVELKEYGCDEYIHLHIIPRGNDIFKNNLANWEKLLKNNKKYKVLSPEELLQPIYKNEVVKWLFKYLYNRYIEKYI
jgi:hypothetical protein